MSLLPRDAPQISSNRSRHDKPVPDSSLAFFFYRDSQWTAGYPCHLDFYSLRAQKVDASTQYNSDEDNNPEPALGHVRFLFPGLQHFNEIHVVELASNKQSRDRRGCQYNQSGERICRWSYD
jgi:hypothetical protein